MKQVNKHKFVIKLGKTMGLNLVSEFPFAKELRRKFRFDYADTEKRIAIELEGGVWTHGRHTRPEGYMNDIEKYNIASALGWTLIRVPSHLVLSHLGRYIAEAKYFISQSAVQRAIIAIRAAEQATKEEIALIEKELKALKKRSKARKPKHANIEEGNGEA